MSTLEEELLTLSYKYNNEITLAIDDILSLLSTTVKGCLPEKREDVNPFSHYINNNDGFNTCLDTITKNLKEAGLI